MYFYKHELEPFNMKNPHLKHVMYNVINANYRFKLESFIAISLGKNNPKCKQPQKLESHYIYSSCTNIFFSLHLCKWKNSDILTNCARFYT